MTWASLKRAKNDKADQGASLTVEKAKMIPFGGVGSQCRTVEVKIGRLHGTRKAGQLPLTATDGPCACLLPPWKAVTCAWVLVKAYNSLQDTTQSCVDDRCIVVNADVTCWSERICQQCSVEDALLRRACILVYSSLSAYAGGAFIRTASQG